MKKRALFIALSVIMVFSLMLGACTNSGTTTPTEPPVTDAPAAPTDAPPTEAPEATEEPTEPEPEEELSLIMVTDVGGINDASFNQSAWEGLKKAEADFGFKVSFIESKQEQDYIANLETAVTQGATIIWGVGFMMGDALLEAAKNNPNQLFAAIDVGYDPADHPKNLVTVNFKAQEGSFLVGYIAGKTTKTNKVGFVGGVNFPLINAFEYGFIAGVKTANPDCEVFSQYADSFNDAAKGKSIAQQMFKDGADIIYHAAGATGNGVIQEADEQGEGKWAIGVDRDQNDLAPDSVLTSAMKEVGNAIYNVAKNFKETGEMKGGENVDYGLKEGGVGIAPTSDKNVSAEVLADTDALAQKVIAGEIVVPATEDELNDYIANLK